MPIYESKCSICDKKHEYVSPVFYRQDTPVCCGKATEKMIFSAPVGVVDMQPFEAYQSPATGKWISSKAQRAEDMAESNTRPWEGIEQEKKEAERQKAYEEQRQDKELTACVEKTFKELPDHKKDQVISAFKD